MDLSVPVASVGSLIVLLTGMLLTYYNVEVSAPLTLVSGINVPFTGAPNTDPNPPNPTPRTLKHGLVKRQLFSSHIFFPTVFESKMPGSEPPPSQLPSTNPSLPGLAELVCQTKHLACVPQHLGSNLNKLNRF